MATLIDNPKGFKVIKASAIEITEIEGLGICDSCNKPHSEGYLIPVLNAWYCPRCYTKWMGYAKRYNEDIPYELRQFNHYKEVFDL